jgi:O-antigen ligase
MLGLLVIVAIYAFDKAYRVPRVFLIFMLAAGTLRFGGNVGDVFGGSTNLSSIWLLCLILLGLVAALRAGVNPTRYSKPEIMYLFFLSWCVIEVLRSDNYLFGMRMFLKLFYPFLVMFLARNIVNSEPMTRGLMKWVMIAAAISYLFVGGLTQTFLPPVTWAASRYLWAVAAYADYAALMCVFALVCWRYFDQTRYLVLAALLGSTSVFIGVRTGLLATAVGVGIFLALEYRRRAVPLLTAVVVSTLAVLVFVPEFRDKMFMDTSRLEARDLVLSPTSVSIDQINSSGRFAMWAAVMDRFFDPNPATGAGLGSTQHWFYSGGYGAIQVEHSEFVRLLADTGLIGCGLYILIMLVAMSVMWRLYHNAQNRLVHYLAVFTFCSFPTYMICMAFDNVINYTLCAAQYPFALTGVTIGLYETVEARRTETGFNDIPTIPTAATTA